MKDPFLEQQWRELNERLRGCATHIAESDETLARTFAEQAAAFGDNDPPDRYPRLLECVRQAAEMAVAWQNQRDARSSHWPVHDREAASDGSGSREAESADDTSSWAASAA